ncbi:hypothetical protein XAC902_480001 [Xanthomonas citri pv. citri]|nr:hypothetical protein XAC902_480001 [Xanthomonas citri pv. citri]
MDTSESAIFHGLEMSRKSWAYQFLVADQRDALHAGDSRLSGAARLFGRPVARWSG